MFYIKQENFQKNSIKVPKMPFFTDSICYIHMNLRSLHRPKKHLNST